MRLSAELIARLEKESLDIFRAITNRGSEIGGLLLGYVLSRSPLSVLVEDYEPFPCSFSLGPTFRLSPEEIDKLGEAVAKRKTAGGLISVGFFRSNTRPACALSEDDLALFDKLFPEEHNIFALAKPFSRKPCVGAIFVREQGRIRGESSYLEFPFSQAELEKTGALQPGLRVVSAESKAAPEPEPEVKPEPAPPPRVETMKPPVPTLKVSVQPAFRRPEPPPPSPPPPPPVAPPPKVEARPIVETKAIVTPVTPSLRRQEPPAEAPAAPASRPVVPAARPVFMQRTIARTEPPTTPSTPVAAPEPKPAPRPEPVAVAPAKPEPIPEPRIKPAAPPAPEPAPKAARPAYADVEKPPETEPAPVPTEFSFHYGEETESHGKRWLILAAIAVVIAAAIGGYSYFSGRKPAATPVSAVPAPPPVTLTLTVEGADRGVAIHWDGGDPALSSVTSGTLTIRDGGVPSDVTLTADQLKSGVYNYRPKSDDLSVRLEAGRAVGSTRVLGATRLKKIGGR